VAEENGITTVAFLSLASLEIVYAECLEKRCCEIFEPKLRDTRCEFHPGHSTTDHLGVSRTTDRLGVYQRCLQIADDLELLAFSGKCVQHALDRFSVACDRAGMIFSTKNIAVLCLTTKPSQWTLQVSGNRLQQVEKFKYIGVGFTSDGRQNGEVDTWIVKANAVLRERYRSVATKRELSNHLKAVSFSIDLRSDLDLWS